MRRWCISRRLLTFVGWLIATGDMHRAITIAIAVLIITCPCALGLAVPMVQVVAARRLFESGIMVKDGGALERLAEIDTVVFDKTGTLTLGRAAPGRIAAASTTRRSRSPPRWLRIPAILIRARWSKPPPVIPRLAVAFDEISEHPGYGLEARAGAIVYRLGRPEWALADAGRR